MANQVKRKWFVVIANNKVQGVGCDLCTMLGFEGEMALAYGSAEIHIYHAVRRKTACKIAAADLYVQICERLIKEFDLGFV